MDLASLIGLIGGIVMVVWAMAGSSGLDSFVDTTSILIVLCGTPLIVMMKFNLQQFFGAFKIMIKAFVYKSEKPEALIQQSIQLSDMARKGGLLALEEAEIDNGFMQKGVDMLVDGHDAVVVKQTLEKDIELTANRHEQGVQIFKAIGDVAPAMGMIGTLVGLVGMLKTMDDPSSIGPMMAVALLTTLYGAMLANMVALPIADKLTLRKDEEVLNRSLVLDAIIGLQSGLNPKVVEGVLKNYLSESKREQLTAGE